MKFFSYDGFPAQAIRFLWRLALLNLCYMLCCSTAVLFGAATSALYAVFLNSDGDERLLRLFFLELRRNLRRGTAVGAVFLGIWAVLGVDVYCLLCYDFPGETLAAAVTVPALVYSLSAAAFAFPLQARYDNPVPVTVRNALTLGGAMLPRGVLMAAIGLLPALVFPWSPGVFIRLLALWLLAGFSVSAKLNSLLAAGAFRKIESRA